MTTQSRVLPLLIGLAFRGACRPRTWHLVCSSFSHMVLKAAHRPDRSASSRAERPERCVNCHGSRSKNSVAGCTRTTRIRHSSSSFGAAPSPGLHADARPRRAARCARITHGQLFLLIRW